MCSLFAALGRQEPCGPERSCPKFFGPAEPPVDPDVTRRLRLLIRLEAMVNVGAKFAPNDLPPNVWDGLIVLAQERQRMSDRLREARERKGPHGADESKKIQDARKLDNIPPPGGRIFT